MRDLRGDEALMRRALALARAQVDAGGGPFGAVVARAGRVVAEGANRVTATNDPTAHAEIVAIREACRALGTFSLAGCVMYASCEPCPMCLGAIYWARLDRLCFAGGRDDAAAAGFDDARVYGEIVRAPEARALPTARLLAHEAHAPFAAWAAKPDKIPY